MRTVFRWAAAAVVAVTSMVTAVAAWADPPSRVGRVSVQAGEVMVAHAGGDWRPVQNNYPVTSGDNFFVSYNGRAELDFGSGVAWVSGGTTIYLEQLDDTQLRLRVSSGEMILRIHDLQGGEFAHVDTRRGSIDLTQAGLYRIESDSPNAGGNADLLHVKFGAAELVSGSGFERLYGGDAVQFDGYQMGFLNIRGDDAFGAWADSRDRRFAVQASYVSPRMIGWQDLNDYGTWREVDTYGAVWFPRRVGSDWAPYRYGRWSYVAPWGWTWVDDAPWGFAPFHYGRWVNLNGRWAWAPGQFERNPVYAPALVAWYGGDGFSMSVNVNNSLVYWTPLSWGEAYYPSYYVSANRWRSLNRPYVGDRIEYRQEPPRGIVYRNWNVRNGATAVEAGVIAAARPVAPAARPVEVRNLPTTTQMENYHVRDRIKPAYAGAPSAVVINQVQPRVREEGARGRNNEPIQTQIIAPIVTQPLAAPVRSPGSTVQSRPVPIEAGRAAAAPQAVMPATQPATQPAPTGRIVPTPLPNVPAPVAQPPAQQMPIQTQPAPRVVPVQPQAPAPITEPLPRQPMRTSPQPVQQPRPPQSVTPNPVAAPVVGTQPQPQPATRVAPAQSAPVVVQQEGARRVVPAQGRGEAQPMRQDVQQRVVPIQPQVAPQPAVQPPAPPQQSDRVRRAPVQDDNKDNDKADRGKPQR